MLYSEIRNSVINFANTKDLKNLNGINLSDIFNVSLDLELYDVLLFIKFHNLDYSLLSQIVTFHFRQSLIEENEKVYKFIYENFGNYIEWIYFYPSFENKDNNGIYSLLNKDIFHGSYHFLKKTGFCYDYDSSDE